MLTDLANILVGIGVACVVLFIPPLLIMAIVCGKPISKKLFGMKDTIRDMQMV
jgi:Ca2+/H+ antiporter